MQTFLIVRLGSLGDIVHAIPAAAALRHAYPQARIDWLVDPAYVSLLELVECIDERIPFDPRGLRRLDSRARWTLRRLRNRRYEAVVDLQGLLKSAVLARWIGRDKVIGFSRAHLRERAARFFYAQSVDVGSARHVIQKNLALVAALGVRDQTVHFPVANPRTRIATEISERLGMRAFVVLNPGAAWPNKRWPPERLGAVAAFLQRDCGLRSVVLWGPGEESLAESVVAASEGSAEMAPPTTIQDVVAIARAARVFVSGDTGPLHLAAAVGTPVVALFGPTFAERNGPWSPRDIVVSRTDQCKCLYQRRCRNAVPCITDIQVDEVCDAVRRCLQPHV